MRVFFIKCACQRDIGNCLVDHSQTPEELAPACVGDRVRGIELDSSIEVGQGHLIFVEYRIHGSAIDVGSIESWIQANGLVQIAQCICVLLPQHIPDATTDKRFDLIVCL